MSSSYRLSKKLRRESEKEDFWGMRQNMQENFKKCLNGGEKVKMLGPTMSLCGSVEYRSMRIGDQNAI
jgi:hypothetical protein